MIPQDKSAAVTRALREAFGTAELDEIRELTGSPGGNLVYRIVVRGNRFLLRINTRKGDVARQYSCMRAAAEGGLAPRVWYSNVEDRVSITDFAEVAAVEGKDRLIQAAAALRKLHALAAFPGVPDAFNTSCMFLLNKGPVLDGFLDKFRAAKILPKVDGEEFFARYAELAAVYPQQGRDMVSSHNDLFKPDNMLFDGDRLWLVDWEAAFLNDRYADLAVVANLMVRNEDEERAYLREYFGETPDEYRRARFFLMQQVAHVFYAMAFLFLGAAGTPVDWSEAAPGYEEFHRRFRSGEVKLTDRETKIAYGRVHFERLMETVRLGRYREALRIVSEGQGGSTGVSPSARALSFLSDLVILF